LNYLHQFQKALVKDIYYRVCYRTKIGVLWMRAGE